ncbi:MAG: pyridoxamine 5'-phosphate oxidase family protein [Gammaproteobacteria bacterium]|nr:pyridoxamine 5'-phosphate oxidase family protein [Gammaproteobacteria bacterium]
MPSRRKLIEMTDEERDEYIANAHTLIIVSNGKNGYPHPMPMWFAVDDDGSLICTTFVKSQKVLNWQRDPKASLLIESGQAYNELRGVVVYAETELNSDQKSVVDTLVKINSKGRDLNSEQLERLRSSVASTAGKRIQLKFKPSRYVTWDHTKLEGKY